MASLTLIGDVHGYYDDYLEIAQASEASLQLGDLGFDYGCLALLDPTKHKVLAGNHDNYSQDERGVFSEMQTGHFLGDYGVWASPIGNAFFFRGERSIDWKLRRLFVDFFPDEELDNRKANNAINLYKLTKPDLVFSHGCPESLIPKVSRYTHFMGEELRPSKTSFFLEAALKYHRPKVWVFGHYHVSFDAVVNSTRFICLDELEALTLEKV